MSTTGRVTTISTSGPLASGDYYVGVKYALTSLVGKAVGPYTLTLDSSLGAEQRTLAIVPART